MIALITSTIIPEAYSFFNIEERYQQTIDTINNLKRVGFEDIYLIDNSVDVIDTDRIKLNSFHKLNIIHTPQYNFRNKGLNEALLILNHLSHLPDNQPVFKISGRYSPTEHFNRAILLSALAEKEILGVGNIKKSINSYFNTRAYLVNNKRTLEAILVSAVEEMIAYGRGINGYKGLIKLLKTMFRPQVGTPFQISIESALANILSAKTNYKLVEKINIEGFVAGAKNLTFISE
ncbi:hypothetical protein SAMN05421827_106164 [Pedobacter terrae]|uniref:Uncharacterized protein n=1 Tax=Pedobacter terrae TaxID=405671 RepID=A0A1G7U5Z8_9SPHI|nr:hypothetical protein [Pedobacter terrae]SDG42170.1 hypothetical protein SAMN05421827_106164 [Pedobacter terrae]